MQKNVEIHINKLILLRSAVAKTSCTPVLEDLCEKQCGRFQKSGQCKEMYKNTMSF